MPSDTPSALSVEGLRARKEALQAELAKVLAAINSLCAVCAHEMEPNGHDSHHRYFKCKHCGHEDSD